METESCSVCEWWLRGGRKLTSEYDFVGRTTRQPDMFTSVDKSLRCDDTLTLFTLALCPLADRGTRWWWSSLEFLPPSGGLWRAALLNDSGQVKRTWPQSKAACQVIESVVALLKSARKNVKKKQKPVYIRQVKQTRTYSHDSDIITLEWNLCCGE